MKPTDGIINARWKKIKQSLAEIGIDADTISTNSQFSAEFPRAPMLPLRQVLQEMANFHVLHKPPTPYERADQSKAAQAAADETLKQLQRLSSGRRNYPDYAQIHHYRERYDQLCEQLVWAVAELQKRREALRDGGSSSKQNARNAQRDHWHALADLWLNITMLANASKHRRKHLTRFLLACTAGPEREIENFVRNFLAKRS
jgi:hypothetical protein